MEEIATESEGDDRRRRIIRVETLVIWSASCQLGVDMKGVASEERSTKGPLREGRGPKGHFSEFYSGQRLERQKEDFLRCCWDREHLEDGAQVSSLCPPSSEQLELLGVLGGLSGVTVN